VDSSGEYYTQHPAPSDIAQARRRALNTPFFKQREKKVLEEWNASFSSERCK
jgi:hypothetical protein